jgi:hypothetical protein
LNPTHRVEYLSCAKNKLENIHEYGNFYVKLAYQKILHPKHSMMKNVPFHTVLLSIYFPLVLLSSNLGEVNPVTITRLIILMLLISLASLFFLNLFFRDLRKAGLLASFLIIFFSTYGLLYSFFKSSQVFNLLFGHHRVLASILIAAFIIIGITLSNKIRHLVEITLLINLFTFFLLIMPFVQITLFSYPTEKKALSTPQQEDQAAQKAIKTENLPDIYYIILDSYDRQDYLASEFNYDNSEFLHALSNAGFYIADCSRSNYAHTFLSLSSTLNMAYVQDFLLADNLTEKSLKDALVHSQFRNNITELGYQIVTFDNIHWDFSDADRFYEFKVRPILNPYLFPIESAFIDNSVLKIIKDINPSFLHWISSLTASAVKDHYLQQKYLLDSLDGSTLLDSPKFVFAHIEKPHGPYVFEPNGDFIEEDAFYRDKYFAAINQDYSQLGYIKQVKFINHRMIKFVDQLHHDKNKDAIIIIQGDHGIQENEDLNSRMAILYAIYLPGQDYSLFHPALTPVNTFRIIQDQFFSDNLGLLEDMSFYSHREDKMEYFPVEESMLGCKMK